MYQKPPYYENLPQFHKNQQSCIEKFGDKLNSYGISDPYSVYVQQQVRNLMKKYGINIDVYFTMYNNQDRTCAICLGKRFKNRTLKLLPLSIDHCHKTGKVRGLVCPNCNAVLGHSHDDILILKRAIDYLNNNQIK